MSGFNCDAASLTNLGILILGVFVFPICALWLNTESVLLLVQQEPCVAR